MEVRKQFGLLGMCLSCAASAAVLLGCASMPKEHPTKDGIETFAFENVPALEHTKLKLGGFSGLVFEGFSRATGEYDFTTHTDRGPNLDVRKDSRSKELRPFVDPEFTPRWVTFSYKPKKHSVGDLDQIKMTSKDGHPLTGLPNLVDSDEVPIDARGHRLRYDPMGLDTEGIAKDPADGSYWMCEEYRPSLLHFDAKAHLLERFVPKGSPAGTGTPTLPAWYSRRMKNRGFEGVAIDGDLIYGFLQSPLQDERDITRVLSIEKTTGSPVAEYAYAFERPEEGKKKVDKLGDAVSIAPGRFLVIEQNSETNEAGVHSVYEVDVSHATNLLDRKGAELSRVQMCEGDAGGSCVTPVKKTLVADLVAMGLHGFDKIEGLAVIDAQTLALVNDNDFDVDGRGQPSAFFIVHLAKPLQLR